MYESVSVVVKNVIKKDIEEEEEDLMEAVVVVTMTAELLPLRGKVNLLGIVCKLHQNQGEKERSVSQPLTIYQCYSDYCTQLAHNIIKATLILKLLESSILQSVGFLKGLWLNMHMKSKHFSQLQQTSVHVDSRRGEMELGNEFT